MNRLQKRTTAFVTPPIVALAAAALGVVLVSLAIGARETDGIALTRQRETIEHAIDQHGLSLARELRMQTVWSEAYEKTRALDTAWMRAFYGIYLTHLLGYDGIYVLGADNRPVFGYMPSEPTSNFASIGSGLTDLLEAVRNPQSNLPAYNAVETDVTLGDGKVVQHRAVADVRAIHGRPATVIISTIDPDRGHRAVVTGEPMLLWRSKTWTRRSPNGSAKTSAFATWSGRQTERQPAT